jgi:hypothetical protein
MLMLRQYKSAGGSAPPATLEAAEAVPEELAAGAELVAVVPAPPPTREGQEVSLLQPAEAAESTATAAAADSVEDIVGVVGSSSPHSVAVGAD